MTKKLEDGKYFTTKFSAWLRDQKELDSNDGYVATDIDMVWLNYKTGEIMLIEEKCQNSGITKSQETLLMRVHNCMKTDPLYRGFYLIKFQRESPDDGDIYVINMANKFKKQVTKKELLFLLANFRLPNDDFELDFWKNF